MSAKSDMQMTDLLSAGTRERRIDRPGVPFAALLAVLTAAGATWYGFLEQTHGHPTVRLAGALALATGGLAAALLATPRPLPNAEPAPGAPRSPGATAEADG